MPIFTKHRDRSGLTASAVSIDPGNDALIRRVHAARQKWQLEAWPFFDKLAEVHYPLSYTGDSVGQFNYPVARRSVADPLADPIVPDEADRDDLYRAAQDALWALEGPLGGVDELARLFAINAKVCGEGYLVGEDHNGTTDWEYLSVLELVPGAEQGTWSRSTIGDPSSPDSGSGYKPYVKRMWHAHPGRTFVADSPLKSLSDDCLRLIALNDSMTSRILNRMAQSGILFIPSGLAVVGEGEAPPPDSVSASTVAAEMVDPARNDFWRTFLNRIQTTILHRNTAAGAIPIILQGNREDGEAIRHITMDRTIDRVEMELRAELRSNIATGQDLPAEVQQGALDVSFRNAWSISDSSYQSHLLPVAKTWSNNVTRQYLWPALRAWLKASPQRSKWTEDDIRRLVVWPDGSHVVSRPNAAEDRRQLSDRAGVIKDSVLRSGSAVTEDDKPDDAEALRQFGRQAKNPFLFTYGLPIHDEVDWDMVARVGAAEGAPGVGGTPPSRRPADSSDPSGPPNSGKKKNKAADSAVWAAFAEGHMHLARQRVGSKVRGLAQRDPAIAAEIKNVANDRVLSAVDTDDLDLGVDDIVDMYLEALMPLGAALGDVAHRDDFIQALAAWEAIHPTTAASPAILLQLAEGVLNPPSV